MTRHLVESPGYSSSAVDSTVTIISIERTGLDENGELVSEAADVDDSQETVRLTMKTAGKATAPTPVRNDIHARLVLRMRVPERLNNNLGNMHGGCGATLVDCVTSMAIYYHTSGVAGSPWSFLGVSQNINVFYLNACPVNSVIEMEVYTASVGKTIALIAADFWLVERADGQEDDGEGPVHAGKWKRIKKTISGTHTKVSRPFSLRSYEVEALPEKVHWPPCSSSDMSLTFRCLLLPFHIRLFFSVIVRQVDNSARLKL